LLRETSPDLVLTGVQAHNDLDGALGALLAGYLEMPYVGYVSGVKLNAGMALVRKEYPGGLIAEMEVALPAVLGVQAAERPLSYVAFSRIRQAMKTAALEEQPAGELMVAGGPEGGRMYKPESGARAQMLDGNADQVATRLIQIFQELGVL
jgi:electron transfer flavoprotein beta subunit